MQSLNFAVRHVTDGFIGILDMFGFENPKKALIEHLLVTLTSYNLFRTILIKKHP